MNYSQSIVTGPAASVSPSELVRNENSVSPSETSRLRNSGGGDAFSQGFHGILQHNKVLRTAVLKKWFSPTLYSRPFTLNNY